MRLVIVLLLAMHSFAFGGETGSTYHLRNTYYYVVLESEYEGLPRTEPIQDMEDNVLAMVSARFKRALRIEGTGRLMDGRIVNFAGRKNGEIRYLVTEAPWGLGVGNCPLRPFRTVAVDRNLIPLGSLVHIRETVGMELPDGTLHDGYWRAEDVGGGIRGDRVDLFVGDGDRGDVLKAGGIRHLQALTVELVELPQPQSCVDETPR